MKSRRCWLSSWFLEIFTLWALLSVVLALPQIIKIGGLFESNDYQMELAFRKTIEMINSDLSKLSRTKLEALVKNVAPQDSFRALKTACDFLEEGVAAIIAPRSLSNLGVIQSTCDNFEVPLLQTHWSPRNRNRTNSLNFFPDSRTLATYFSEFIANQNWRSYTLIFEDSEALIRLQEILQIQGKPLDQQMKVILRHVKPEEDFTKFLKDLKKLRENNFVVDLPLHRVKDLFIAAEKIDMLTEYQNYILTTLDIQTVDWAQNLIGRSNVTSFRIINPENSKFQKFVDDWIFTEKAEGNYVPSKQPITTEAALMFDAILMLSKALDDLDRVRPIQLKSMYCDGSSTWPEGTSLVNYMKLMEFEGTSGTIKIDRNGLRSDFTLEVIKVNKKAIQKTATYEKGVQLKEDLIDEMENILELLSNTTLKVTSILTDPYLMRIEPVGELKGNDRFEGFCKDLLDKLSSTFKFKYIITPVFDLKHGSLQPDGSWNGMIGELLKGEAQIAIGDLTITSSRESAVEFTMPFMNLGISILFKKPEKESKPLFSFFQPLSIEVWFYMGTAYLGITLYLFILARLSPYEWFKPKVNGSQKDIVSNRFTLHNSFYFMMGSLMKRGCHIMPRAISTRIVASSWWFFTLIMISSYTANLAAFLTAQRMTAPIESAADLAKQTKIQYGCVGGGSTMNFFKETEYPIYKRMWSFMESQRPSVFPENNEKGIERVKMGNYAFLMESTSIDYETERNCDLQKVGQELDSKGYGIATPKGSPYRGILSNGILTLQESQELQVMKEKWWKKGKVQCTDDSSTSNEMGIRNVGGVFLVLAIGTMLGGVIVVMEFVWKANKMMDRGSIYSMLWQELKSTLSCRGSTRPAPKDSDEPSVEKMPMVNMSKIEDLKYS